MKDDNTEISVLVDRSVGGSTIKDGELELMLHRFSIPIQVTYLYYSSLETCYMGSPSPCRRLHDDDSRGVAEALNETVCVFGECTGLTVSIL